MSYREEGPAGVFRAELRADEYGDIDSPRDYAGRVAVIACADSRTYNFPQEDDEVVHALRDDMHSHAVIARWLKVFHGATVVLPLFEDGRGGLWCGGENELGGRGLVFDTPDSRKAAWGDETPTREQVAEALRAEVKEYSQWATGDVWGVIIEQLVSVDTSDGAQTWEEVGACFGYVDQEWAEQSAREELVTWADSEPHDLPNDQPRPTLRGQVEHLVNAWERVGAAMLVSYPQSYEEMESDAVGATYVSAANELRRVLDRPSA